MKPMLMLGLFGAILLVACPSGAEMDGNVWINDAPH